MNEKYRNRGLAKIQERQHAEFLRNRERVRQAWVPGIKRIELCQKVGMTEKTVSQHVRALGLEFGNGRKSKKPTDMSDAMKLASMRW